jgi:type III restriction enzyme
MSDVLNTPRDAAVAGSFAQDIVAAQSNMLEPERFQRRLIESMTETLLREPSPPSLLRAPTGSGKTFVISRVLANISAKREVLWFWFVPFVNLVQQTEDALTANCAHALVPAMLSNGRNAEPAPGMVLLSTAQGVAKATQRTKGYDADNDDDTRSIAAFVARARARGLDIGLVVDEAHIALDSTTEFGSFAQWLDPKYLLMATATPKDQRLNEFLAKAGRSEFVSFNVSRAEVVGARLNKRYIQAVIYQSASSIQTITDTRGTVLREAWKRNKRLRKELNAAGVDVVPLLLVQVPNGETTVDDAERDLMRLCNVPLQVIGKHSADKPDPVLMAAIANDRSKEVLIFKQSAGTGFDAPRAFVLASTKPVNDPDFATQFIGRVMRVVPQIRARYPKPAEIPADFDTAFIYLANAEAQSGFQASVESTAQVKNQLEGQTEKLLVRQTVSGAVVYTNRTTDQSPVTYDMPLPAIPLHTGTAATNTPAQVSPLLAPLTEQVGLSLDPLTSTLFADEPLDELQPVAPVLRPSRSGPFASADVLRDTLAEHGLRTYPLRDTFTLPRASKREERPQLTNMSAISRAVAMRLEIAHELERRAVDAALNRLKGTERRTEMTQHTVESSEIAIVTDRDTVAAEARSALAALPQVEDEDVVIIVTTIAARLMAAITREFEHREDYERPAAKALERYARDAANWVIRLQADLLREALEEEIAKNAALVDAAALPDAMVFPSVIALEQSSKNIYGVLPPSSDDIERGRNELFMDDANWFEDRTYRLTGGGEFRVGEYDGVCKLNGLERRFAEALDTAPFVHWWHRNPDRKPYAVSVVRADHKNYFYPDFVVCIEHDAGDELLLRLIETKDDTKDAARKARYVPKLYGKVLFLSSDRGRLKVINDDGSLADSVDMDSLGAVRAFLARTRPII